MSFNLQFSSIFSSVDEYDFNFGEGALELYQIYTDDDYIYTATNTGLRVFDADTDEYVAYIDYDGGFTSVDGNEDFVFLGTTGSGVKCVQKTCVTGDANVPVILLTCLNDYVYSPYITSNNVSYISVKGNFLSAITPLGIDVIKMGSQGYRSFTTFSGFERAEKCFITSKGEVYYTVSGTGGYRLDLMYTTLCDWAEVDYKYLDFHDQKLNDIFITEGTSLDGISNTIFVATTSGVYVIDDGTKQVSIYYNES